MTGIVWLALDGVGHPLDAPPDSPWEVQLRTLRPVIDAGQALDARLNVDGLPQSATGQTCWLTGENAVSVMRGHYGPRPGPTLRGMLERSTPVRVTQAGGRVELLNDYPGAYFERTRFPHGCFPWSALYAGRSLNPEGFPLITPTLGLNFDPPHQPGTPLEEVRHLGEAVGKSARHADLIMLDLWFSDYLGHHGRPGEATPLRDAARNYLTRLDALLEGLLRVGARVVITSDHGNFEDLNVKSHTLARVPFASVGVPLPPARDIVAGGQVIARLLGV